MATDYLLFAYPEGALSDEDFACVNSGSPDSKWFHAPKRICPSCGYTLDYFKDEDHYLKTGPLCPCGARFENEKKVICKEREEDSVASCSHWDRMFSHPAFSLSDGNIYSTEPLVPKLEAVFEYIGEDRPYIDYELIAGISKTPEVYNKELLDFLSEHLGDRIFCSHW